MTALATSSLQTGVAAYSKSGRRSLRGRELSVPRERGLRRRFFWCDRSLNRAWRTWLSGWCRTSCGYCSGGLCRRRKSYVRRAAAGVERVTAKPWPRSSSWRPRAAPGGSSRQCSAQAGRRSTDVSPSGAGLGSGPDSTASSLMNSGLVVLWTGRGVRSTPSACGPQRGASDGTESDRPWQARIENPPDHRPERTPALARHLGREHARQSRS